MVPHARINNIKFGLLVTTKLIMTLTGQILVSDAALI
jgi:hypothetical protein